MLRSLELGLPLRDWEDLTFGMIMGLIIAFINGGDDDGEEKGEGKVRQATQVDFDRF